MEPFILSLGVLAAGGAAGALGAMRRTGRRTRRWVDAFAALTGQDRPDPRNVTHGGWRYSVARPAGRADLQIGRPVREDVRLALAWDRELPQEVAHWPQVQVDGRWAPFVVRAEPTDGAREWTDEAAWALTDARRAVDASSLTVVIRGGHARVTLFDALPSGPGLKRCQALLGQIESGAA